MTWSSTATSLGQETAGAACVVSDVFRLDLPRADALRSPRRGAGLTLAMNSTPSYWSACSSIQIFTTSLMYADLADKRKAPQRRDSTWLSSYVSQDEN
jgi:hypothetical protein